MDDEGQSVSGQPTTAPGSIVVSTMDLRLRRLLPTHILGRVWKGAYFSFCAPLQVRSLPRPERLPDERWVRVQNRLAGICGSDLHLVFTDGDPRLAIAALPKHTLSYPGHEVVGEVIEVGRDVHTLRAGDRVVKQYEHNCLSMGLDALCHACATGQYSLCSRIHHPDPRPLDGGWSEEMVLPEQQLFRVPVELGDEQAVMLEPTAVALHAVLRRLPQPGERVLVVGAGSIGLLVLQVLRALAPQAEVSVLARHRFQVEQAMRMGATHILSMRDSYERIAQITGAERYAGRFAGQMLLGGFDEIYDTVGSQATLHHSLRWTRAGGVVVLLGVNLHLLQLDLSPVWYQEVSLLGSMAHGSETWPVGSAQQRSSFALAAELIAGGQLHPEKLITHRFPLGAYREALQVASQKGQSGAIKVILNMG